MTIFQSKSGLTAVGVAAAALAAQFVGDSEKGILAGAECLGDESGFAAHAQAADVEDVRTMDVFVTEGVQVKPGGGAKLMAALRSQYGLSKAHCPHGMKLPESFVKSFCGDVAPGWECTYSLKYRSPTRAYELRADAFGDDRVLPVFSAIFSESGKRGHPSSVPLTGVLEVHCDDAPVRLPRSLHSLYDHLAGVGFLDRAKFENCDVPVSHGILKQYLPKGVSKAAQKFDWSMTYDGSAYSLVASEIGAKSPGIAAVKFVLPEDL